MTLKWKHLERAYLRGKLQKKTSKLLTTLKAARFFIPKFKYKQQNLLYSIFLIHGQKDLDTKKVKFYSSIFGQFLDYGLKSFLKLRIRAGMDWNSCHKRIGFEFFKKRRIYFYSVLQLIRRQKEKKDRVSKDCRTTDPTVYLAESF